jgi:hypothetical protein
MQLLKSFIPTLHSLNVSASVNPRKFLLSIMLIPTTVWFLCAGIIWIRSHSDRKFRIFEGDYMSISAQYTGTRHVEFLPIATIGLSKPNVWVGTYFTVKGDRNSGSLNVSSPRLTDMATLAYDGHRWTGYAHTPGRRLPILIEAW